MAVEVLDCCESTQTLAMEAARADAPGSTAFAAHRQTAGFGRRGDAWESPAGGFYFSEVLRPNVPMSMLQGIAPLATLAVLEGLESLGVPDCRIKWPNDVVCGGRKLAGVIAQAGVSDNGVFVVVGIGINIAPVEPEHLDQALYATSVDEILEASGEELALRDSDDAQKFDALLETVYASLGKHCEQWVDGLHRNGGSAGPLGPFMHEYYDRLWLMGEQVIVSSHEGGFVMDGRFAGLDGWGRACVVDHAGAEHDFTPEQVMLRPLP